MSVLIVQYFLNHRLEADELRRQMAEIAAAGYEGIYAHARSGLLTPYFSEDWWRALDVLVECCERLGLEFWIWDDDFFPSGPAGGRVVWSDPGLVARELRFKVAEVEGAGPFELDFEPGMLVRAFAVPDSGSAETLDITAHCGTIHRRWGPRYVLHRAYSPDINRVGHPHWRTSNDDNGFSLLWAPPQPGRYTLVGVTTGVCSADHPDLLRPEGIRRFLELTHDEYAKRYADRFGRAIVGSFTDEPSPGAWLFPWSDGMPAEFERDHGYDLRNHLPHLALDLDERSAVIRHHYRQTQHRLVRDNYVQQVGDWLHEHGLQHVGHLTRTEWLSLSSVWWPNELRCYEPMDIPMADPLGGSVGFPDAAAYHTGLKVVSSAAHLFGKAQAGADCFAVIGEEAGLRELKYLADYHLAMGINHFAVHGWSYSFDGLRKDEVPPSLGYQHTECKHMRVLWDHVRETAEALTGGEHLCRIAVLHPSTSLACQARPGVDWMHLPDETLIHNLAETLLSHHCDFDLIDEMTLAERVDAQGVLHTAEPYETIILPYLRYLDAGAAEALQRFAAAGGTVIAVGHDPVVLDTAAARFIAPGATDGRDESRRYGRNELRHYWEAPTAERIATLPGVAVDDEGAQDVFVLQRQKEGAKLTFAFNRSRAAFSGQIEGQPVWIAPGSSVLLQDGAPISAPLPPPDEQAIALDLSCNWQLTFEDNHVPLSFWHVPSSSSPFSSAFTEGAGYDLMQRQPDPAPAGEEPVTYYCRFMLGDPAGSHGGIPDARLVIEDSTISGDWTLRLNGVEIRDWERARVFDCLNLQACAGHALRRGSTPTLNVLEIKTRGPGRGLHEIPYLYGSFQAEYRYGHLSFPFLTGASGTSAPTRELPGLLPWDVLGYPTFSGSVTYRRGFNVNEAGDYVLDLGRVEDVAAVTLDGQQLTTLAWEPYRCLLAGLEAGEHVLEIEITNAPANRNRAAGLPAGLLGPVRLFHAPT